MIVRYFLVRPVVLPSRPVMLRALSLTMNCEVRAFGHCLAQCPATAADACCCQVTDRSVRSITLQRRITSMSSFLRDLASGLVPIFVLDFA